MLIGQFQLKSEFRSQFIVALIAVRNRSSQEPRCLGIRLFEDKQTNMFFGYELFTDEEAIAFHRSQPYALVI